MSTIEPRVVEISSALTIILKAMVDHPDAVMIAPISVEEKSVIFRVFVEHRDVGKLVGKQGRTAKSLRVILQAISKVQDLLYALDIEGHAAAETIGE